MMIKGKVVDYVSYESLSCEHTLILFFIISLNLS